MLIIDNREGKLIELIKNTPTFKIPYELKSLQIGDIIIHNELSSGKSIIIERKCVADMLASIKDGRYKEQKIRLLAEQQKNYDDTLICYLIEGGLQDVRYPAEKTVFHGSIVSSIFRDKIPIIRTYNLNETLDMIIRIHDRMAKDITDFFKPIPNPIPIHMPNSTENPIIESSELELQPENQTNTQSIMPTNIQIGGDNTYLNSIKKCKKENLTPQLWNQISLTNIPGVSTSIASKITEVFPTIKQLFQAYNNSETDEQRVLLISEICLIDNGKTKRRIGEVVSKRILEYLYQN